MTQKLLTMTFLYCQPYDIITLAGQFKPIQANSGLTSSDINFKIELINIVLTKKIKTWREKMTVNGEVNHGELKKLLQF